MKPTDLRNEVRRLEKIIMRPVAHAIIGDLGTERVTGRGNVSIVAGNGGPGLVAAPPR